MQCFCSFFWFSCWIYTMQSFLVRTKDCTLLSSPAQQCTAFLIVLAMHLVHAGQRTYFCNVRTKDWHSRHICLLCWHCWRWCTAGWWWGHPAQHLLANFCCTVQIGKVPSHWQALQKCQAWGLEFHFISHDLHQHAVDCPHAPLFSINNPILWWSHKQFKRCVKGEKGIIGTAVEE